MDGNVVGGIYGRSSGNELKSIFFNNIIIKRVSKIFKEQIDNKFIPFPS
jgi:hypothetical protein